MDLRRHRSVLVRMAPDGQRLGKTVRVANGPVRLKREVAKAGAAPRVVLEATLGWYWAAEALEEAGAEVYLAHPLGVKGFACRRVKNDELDAADLADLLRLGRLPEAWIAPAATREPRELVRGRHTLVGLRTSCRNQVHGILGKPGIAVGVSGLFGSRGSTVLDTLVLPGGHAERLHALRARVTVLDEQVAWLDGQIAARPHDDDRYRVLQQIPGIGPVFAAVFCAETGDVPRFPTPGHLCSWAGPTPRHHESDTTVRRGHLTKQGSPLLRFAAVEALQRVPAGNPVRAHKERIETRRGTGARNIAEAAAARKLLTLVHYALRTAHYALRDGEVRCLARQESR